MREASELKSQSSVSVWDRLKSSLTSEATPRDLMVAHFLMLGLLYWGACLQQGSFPDNPVTVIGLLILTPLLLIIPHELGHALTARALGFQNVRIVIGAGPRLWSGRALGFPWVLNRYWISGCALSDDFGVHARWKHFAMITAGPMVNIAMMVVIWLWPPSTALPNIASLSGIVFWANALLLIENLFPAQIRLGTLRVGTDGMQLAQIALHAVRVPGFTSRGALKLRLKITDLYDILVYSVPALTCIVVSGSFVRQAEWTGAPGLMWTLAGLVGALGIHFAYLATRRVKHLMGVDSESNRPAVMRNAWKELMLQSGGVKDEVTLQLYRLLETAKSASQKLEIVESILERFADDPYFVVLKGCYLVQCERYREAEIVLRRAEQLPVPPLSQYLIKTLIVQGLVADGEPLRAETICEEYVNSCAGQTHLNNSRNDAKDAQ